MRNVKFIPLLCGVLFIGMSYSSNEFIGGDNFYAWGDGNRDQIFNKNTVESQFCFDPNRRNFDDLYRDNRLLDGTFGCYKYRGFFDSTIRQDKNAGVHPFVDNINISGFDEYCSNKGANWNNRFTYVQERNTGVFNNYGSFVNNGTFNNYGIFNNYGSVNNLGKFSTHESLNNRKSGANN